MDTAAACDVLGPQLAAGCDGDGVQQASGTCTASCDANAEKDLLIMASTSCCVWRRSALGLSAPGIILLNQWRRKSQCWAGLARD